MKKVVQLILLALAPCILLTGCNAKYKEVVDAWNTRSAAELEQYTALKTAVMPYEQQFINMYLYNYAVDDLKQFFNETTTLEDTEYGAPIVSYYDQVREMEYKDDYDDIIRNAATDAGMPLDEYCTYLATTHDSGFAYSYQSLGLHSFFTSVYMSTMTEIYAIECVNGAELRVIVTWEDGKIIDVERFI